MGRRVLMLGVLLLLVAALGFGFWRHYSLNAQVMATAELRANFVPSVRTAPVRASGSTMSVSWPGTTEAFEQANIFARASGYISKRNVDIGSRVKAGDLLIEITAPELDHQIAQAEGNLAQMQASLEQAKANRDLAQVTWDRDNPLVQKGWVTPQQGDTDRLTLQARDRSGRGRASQHRGAERATAGAQSAEGLSDRGCSIRWRHHPTQCRYRRPGAGRCDQRHVSVHPDAQRYAAHPALRAAGRSLRRLAGRRSGGARTGNAGPRVSRHGDAHRRCAGSRARARC